jgi:hypothetical protein
MLKVGVGVGCRWWVGRWVGRGEVEGAKVEEFETRTWWYMNPCPQQQQQQQQQQQ